MAKKRKRQQAVKASGGATEDSRTPDALQQDSEGDSKAVTGWSREHYDPRAVRGNFPMLVVSSILVVGWLSFLFYVVVNL